MALEKQDRRLKIRRGIRKNVKGTAETPRLSVFRSNKHIFAQVIDDLNGITLASASSLSKEISDKKDINKVEQAKLVGELIAKKALEKGIADVIFDRGGFLYHGRVKSLADSAREGGLKF
jgi:large subunit ribosomal protein L18